MRRAPAWWASRKFPAVALLPLAGVFGVLSALRRGLYRVGVLRREALPVPVIVVGNVAVGGSGKTPVVAWLAGALRAAGHVPGIISRGYGASVAGVTLVTADSDPHTCGDEPVLLARITDCPLAVGADRPAAARALLQAHPECSVIISDDGLQHYRLQREVEVVVVDQATLGNGWLLPAGPLREPLRRLDGVDLIIAHGPLARQFEPVPMVQMVLEGDQLRRLVGDDEWRALTDFRARRVHAIAGIGRPERFFQQLRDAGLEVVPHAFADHHRFRPEDLDFAPGEVKIMTAKDAVKCRSFASADVWELPVVARIDARASDIILEKLTHGRPSA
jgi:tetraacyldisaccharide 4'-kinase